MVHRAMQGINKGQGSVPAFLHHGQFGSNQTCCGSGIVKKSFESRIIQMKYFSFRHSLISYFLYSVFYIPISSAQSYNFRNYSLEEGLTQSSVYTLLQDSRHYLWAGTFGGGLCRFDGISFKIYNRKSGLAGDIVRSLLEDSKGNLWIGTDKGISVFDGLKFRNITAGSGLTGTTVLKLMEDKHQRIWAGTDDGGVNLIIPVKTDSVRIIHYTQTDGLRSDFIFDILEDKSGKIWLATFYGGLNILTLGDNEKISVQHLGLGKIPSDLLVSLEDDGKGKVWVGSYDAGAFCLDASVPEKGVIEGYNAVTGLNDNTVWDIHHDLNDRIWFATNKSGLVRLDRNSGTPHFTRFSQDRGFPDNQAVCLLEDMEGNIWAGTSGKGFCRHMGDHFVHYSDKYEALKSQVYDIKPISSSDFWLGLVGGGITRMTLKDATPEFIQYTTKDGLIDNQVRSITLDSKGFPWLATANPQTIVITAAGRKHHAGGKANPFRQSEL